MKIVVHQDGRDGNNQCHKLLIVTSEATFLQLTFNPKTRFVNSFRGSVWPGELPEVFEKIGQCTNQRPSNTYVKQEIVDRFKGSVASLDFVREEDALSPA